MSPMVQKVVVDDLESLLEVLPQRVRRWLQDLEPLDGLLEIILDLGRPPQARFFDREEAMGQQDTTEDEINGVVSNLSPFGGDNRAGIERDAASHRRHAEPQRQGDWPDLPRGPRGLRHQQDH